MIIMLDIKKDAISCHQVSERQRMKKILPDIPPFSYFHSSDNSPQPFSDEMLETSIYENRPCSSPEVSTGLSYRAYFRFLSEFIISRWGQVVAILENESKDQIRQVDSVQIVAEKSGSDYYPASVKFVTPTERLTFVANVATTSRGRSRLLMDFELLNYFQSKGQGIYLPKPYLISSEREFVNAESDDYMLMFLGQWLDGYHEFHLTRLSGEKDLSLVVWDTDNGLKLASAAESREIYRQTAFILTHYFELTDFREIFPWHHASGDFVVRLGPNLDVKLVTVRQYAPRIQSEKDFELDVHEAALLFLCNLTIRNRVDRLDGVGDMAWGPHYFLDATVEGFFECLNARENGASLKAGFTAGLKSICERLDVIAWTQLFEGTLESFNRQAPDFELIESHLPEHIFEVYRLFQKS